MAQVIIPDSTGHSTVTFDPAVAETVAEASRIVHEHQAKGGLVYRLDEKSGESEVMREFDPQAETICLAPRLVGG